MEDLSGLDSDSDTSEQITEDDIIPSSSVMPEVIELHSESDWQMLQYIVVVHTWLTLLYNPLRLVLQGLAGAIHTFLSVYSLKVTWLY